MTTATLPDFGVSFVTITTEGVETVNVEELTPEKVTLTINLLRAAREVLAALHKSIFEDLCRGVDSQQFAAKYEKAVANIGPITQRLARAIEKTQAKVSPAHAKEIGFHFDELATDLAKQAAFLARATANANAPGRPIDWQRVQEAEAAYARGEMKPFQK
jgi:hypothetical protein